MLAQRLRPGCAAAPNAAKPASTATSPWPQPLSLSVRYAGPPGASTAGTPGQDQHASADLLAGALMTCSRAVWASALGSPGSQRTPEQRTGPRGPMAAGGPQP